MTSDPERLDRAERLTAISGLSEPTRRALYEYVAAADGWVSRDEAADAVGIERAAAVHHLDRLANDGLLEVDYQRRSGRQGPGAGRPAKLYRRAGRSFDVSLPPRDYELAGRLLADAVDRSRHEGVDVVTALDAAAGEKGSDIAAELHDRVRGARTVAGRRRAVLATLEEHGYEPRVTADGTVVLRNCPFHELAQSHTDLVCGMNLSLMRSAVSDVRASGYEACLEPEEGRCCVTLHPRPPEDGNL